MTRRVFEKKKHGRLAYPNDEAGMSKARRNASRQPAAGGYISLSLAAHDDGPKIGLSQGGVPAVETNKRIGRGSAPRGASCSSIDPADYPVAPDSDRRDDRARPVRVNGKCMLIARTKESRQHWCFARPCPARRRILALHTQGYNVYTAACSSRGHARRGGVRSVQEEEAR
jgi:hypothetical protein